MKLSYLLLRNALERILTLYVVYDNIRRSSETWSVNFSTQDGVGSCCEETEGNQGSCEEEGCAGRAGFGG